MRAFIPKLIRAKEAGRFESLAEKAVIAERRRSISSGVMLPDTSTAKTTATGRPAPASGTGVVSIFNPLLCARPGGRRRGALRLPRRGRRGRLWERGEARQQSRE